MKTLQFFALVAFAALSVVSCAGWLAPESCSLTAVLFHPRTCEAP